jgi:hypothetical protein
MDGLDGNALILDLSNFRCGSTSGQNSANGLTDHPAGMVPGLCTCHIKLEA